MAAPNIDAIFTQLSGQISKDIYKRGLHTSPWLDLPKQESWPEGQGHTLSVLTFERSLPSSPLDWQAVTVSAGDAGGICIPPVQRLEIEQTLREYNLYHTSLESPDICVTDLRNSFQVREQMEALMSILSENTDQAWIERNRSEYVRLASHKLIAVSGGVGYVEDDAWLPVMPTAGLTGGLLKRLYARMIRTGAGKNCFGMDQGKPTFAAVMGMETNERVFLESPHRLDVRESSRVPELLAPLGVDRLYKGFWLMDDVFAPRHNLVNGQWVRVPAYKWVGGKLVENPEYDTAETEDTIIYHQDVLRSIIPEPPKSYGQATFDPVSYRGTWSWRNIPHRTENPDGNYGFFRGLFSQGSKPKFPEYGFVVRHLRCDIPIGDQACES